MRLVVTGGSGNVGTALLGLLRDASGITAITAVSEHPPPALAPYDRAEWVACGIGGPDSEWRLAELMDGSTAVVHLAWDIVGARRRPAQRRTNVVGTRQVLAAALTAGVPQLVYVSSVAAYAPEPTHRMRVAEHWPCRGIPGLPYSADKVAVERLLDHAAEARPELRIARLRPPAILQPAAAGELTRYLLGRLAPMVRHRWLRPPVLPLPGSLSMQVVHADDVADLIWRVLRARAAGAYNVADEPVLGSADIAAALGVRRMPAPGSVLRAAMAASAALRVQPLAGAWYDLLARAPLVDTFRARSELGWEPAHRGDQVLAAVRAAAVAGAGTASARLAPEPGSQPRPPGFS